MGKKYLVLLAVVLPLIFALNNCGRKEVAEAPKTEEVSVALTPSTQEVKGEQFTLQLSDLKVLKTIDKSTKEVTTTPYLRGKIKISKQSKGMPICLHPCGDDSKVKGVAG